MKTILSFERNVLLYLLWLATLCCISIISFSQTVDFGKSYINVTKGLNGGTVEPGDTLEIRSSIAVRAGNFDSCSYFDNIPTGTTYVPGTIRVLTNEGKIYKQFTDAINDDCGWINGTSIRINLGYGAVNAATAQRRGRVASNHKPSFYGSSCIMVASFRVRVTAALNTNISLGGGSMTYKVGLNPIQLFAFPANTVRVYQNFGFCASSIGVNAIGTEFNGTFGSGVRRNRSTASANVPSAYTYLPFDIGTPNDYTYGIANNTSTRTNYTTLNTWLIPDTSTPSHRVFGVWDIIGDHTGAVSAAAGNPAADTVGNPNAGYMLVINAAYRIDSAFQQTISGLCPNTYYEISCWMRNICSKCGCDSNGKGATNVTGPPYYIPTGPADSSGVHPNLTFEVNGIDYYTTGNIQYTNKWVKKGFTYLTGPTQTSFTLKFFNNAPGGGGNDWALDDIAVSTCSPNMLYSPSANPLVCFGNPITLYDTVRSFFNNYVYYVWQRSTDNGVTWSNVTSAMGPATPVWTGSAWQHVAAYTVPPTLTQLTDSADRYRVYVATTLSNLSNTNCRFTDSGNVINLNIIDCGIPLGVHLISFSGKMNNDDAVLNWSTGQENDRVFYDIERSNNGHVFTYVGSVDGRFDPGSEFNSYSFIDPSPPGTLFYYRIKIRNGAGESAYTRTVRLEITPDPFSFISVINPFDDQLRYDISSALYAAAKAELVDVSGQVVKTQTLNLVPGVNRMHLGNTNGLSQGIYILRVHSGGKSIHKTVLKQHN